MADFKELIPNPQKSAIWSFLICIGALGTIYRAVSSVAPNGPIFLSALAILILIGQETWRRLKLDRSQGLPIKKSALNPFQIIDTWPRDNEAAELALLVVAEEKAHILVVGPSGAGKTQLVSVLLEPALKGLGHAPKEIRFIFTNQYDTPVVRAIKVLGASEGVRRDEITNTIDDFITDKSKRCSVRDVFDPTCAKTPKFQEAHKIWESVAGFLDDVISQNGITIFAFDQLERVSQSIRIGAESPRSGDNGFEIFFFIKLIKYLQARNSVRTLFVVRAEYLYHAYDFLKNETGRLEGSAQSVSVVHYLCPGINTESAGNAVKQIEADVVSISKDSFFLTSFVKITGLHSRTVSNTFMTRLCGYVVDCYYDKDERVRDMVYKKADRKSFVRFYFDCLFNEYAKLNRDIDAVDILKAVVFSLAVESRLAGQAASVDRISCLTHLPIGDVAAVVNFLIEQGLVVEDAAAASHFVADGLVDHSPVLTYRLVHDIISDFAIEDGKFSFDIRLKDGIRGLSEARVLNLKPVSEFAGPFRDISRVIEDAAGNTGLKSLSTSLIFILLFYAFGAAKVIFDPDVCVLVYPILKHIWFARECGFVSQFYVLVFVTHVVWVTFIYYLDRNFFQFTLDSPVARWASSMVAVVGVVLGIAVSQSPALFLAPVIFGGLAMGGLIIWGTLDGSYRGPSRKEFAAWGRRTMLNMLFVAALTAVSMMILMNDDVAQLFFGSWATKMRTFFGERFDITAETLIVGWMYLVNIVMIAYWWAIRPGQQSKISIAARRALRDRTYFENINP